MERTVRSNVCKCASSRREHRSQICCSIGLLNKPIVRPFIAGDYLIVSEDESYYSHGAGFSADIRAKKN